MPQAPYISICIPAYKKPDYLCRLLDSIASQRFRDFEVIITDDSPGNEISDAILPYNSQFPLIYHKNTIPLGSPANWNQSIQMARGQWIKIMHDDDWFADAESLGAFYQAAQRTTASFIFSGFVNIHTENGRSEKQIISYINRWMLSRSPLYLFRKNYIGHPSTTLIRNNRKEWYDPQLKWVVDFAFYIRLLKADRTFVVIREPLIHIGIGSEQITRQVFRNPEVEIPENLYLLKQLGNSSLKNIFVYDHYWRLIRNLTIRSATDLGQYVSTEWISAPLSGIIRFQQIVGQQALLQSGFRSKMMMFACYLSQRLQGRLNASDNR